MSNFDLVKGDKKFNPYNGLSDEISPIKIET